jgi:GNAT superfamily N-acetyltransferase
MGLGEFSGDLTIVRARKSSLGLAELAQPIGYAAWRKQMPRRPDNQQRNVFNPDDPRSANRLLKRMNSKVGKFVGVVAMLDETPIGYAWAADDVGNMSPWEQRAKTVAGALSGKKPYAWSAQINVLPDYQGRGVGSALLTEVYGPFDDDAKGTAYVFDENSAALGWFRKRGFSPSPEAPVDPNDRPGGPDMYFGEGAVHVAQWRLEAPSTQEVIEITGQIAALPQYQVLERATI